MSVSPGRPNTQPYHLRQRPVLDSLPVKFYRTAEKSRAAQRSNDGVMQAGWGLGLKQAVEC